MRLVCKTGTLRSTPTAVAIALSGSVVAGRPRLQVKPWGGFDDWSASIREPLVWLGLADPCKTRTVVLADDPDREESLAALRALHMKFQDDEFTTKRIMRHCNSGTLRTAMEAVAVGHHKEFDSRSLGWFLRRAKDRVLGGLRLEAVGQISGLLAGGSWRLKVVKVVTVVNSRPAALW